MKASAFVSDLSQLSRIADMHVRQFARRIESGSRNVNVPECKSYLALWRGIVDSIVTAVAKGEKDIELGEKETQELYEAAESGEYDELLSDEYKTQRDNSYGLSE